MLELVYAHEKWANDRPSIFLAGPSPRRAEHYNWRPEAVAILESLGFDGGVFIPLPRDGTWHENYEAQVHWELDCLDRATAIAFWIPRDLGDLPGFTTNTEYGLYARSRKIVLGYPTDAPKMRHLHIVAQRESIPIFHTMRETLACAVAKTRG